MVVLDVDGVLDIDDLSPDLLGTSAEQTAVALDSSNSSLVGRSLKEIERWAIEETLQLTNGNADQSVER